MDDRHREFMQLAGFHIHLSEIMRARTDKAFEAELVDRYLHDPRNNGNFGRQELEALIYDFVHVAKQYTVVATQAEVGHAVDAG
jgi:hypothetical protein